MMATSELFKRKTDVEKQVDYGPGDKKPRFPLGTKVTADGVTYTRFGASKKADWITADGKQFAELPVSAFRVVSEPDEHDFKAAFEVTPIIQSGSRGFGVIEPRYLKNGDVLFSKGFRKQTGTVAGTEYVPSLDAVMVISVVGRRFIPPALVNVYRP